MNRTITSFTKQIKGSQEQAPIVLIHAGAGKSPKDIETAKKQNSENDRIIRLVFAEMLSGCSALDAVSLAMSELENSPFSNAGLGSKLQADGLARLSASMMDGALDKFSAVALATNLHEPSILTKALQSKHNSSLGPLGAQLLARELGLKISNPTTPEQLKNFSEQTSKLLSEPCSGTVGAVALDLHGNLAAATSTGGGGVNDFPGRMSDVSSIAGNFASNHLAVSCTGIGEHIIRDAVAPRLETRVRDGMSLESAAAAMQKDTAVGDKDYAWISIDSKRNWNVSSYSKYLSCSIMHSDLKKPELFQKLS